MTTSTQLSRRKAIAAACATSVGILASAGIARSPQKTKSDGIPQSCNSAKILGKYDPWGVEPNVEVWIKKIGKLPPGLPKFQPKYITLIAIWADGPWDLSVNYASYEIDSIWTDIERLELARTLFTSMKNSTAPNPSNRKKFRDLPQNGNISAGKRYKILSRTTPTHPNPHTKYIDLDGFEFLGSKQQIETFVWIDSSNNLEINKENLISFAPKTITNLPAEKNDRFFAKELISGSAKGKLISIKNFYTLFSESNCTFQEDKNSGAVRLYAMNIHFSLPGRGPNAVRIPMVIDPDTGNGVGYEP